MCKAGVHPGSKMKPFVPEMLRMKFTSLKTTISTQLQINCICKKINGFVLPPEPQSYKVTTVYVPGSKSSPSFVKLSYYPNFDGPALANQSFFKAGEVKMPGNEKVTAVLVIASTDADKAETSY